MTSMLPSAEVAADFKDSLEDLQANNRYEISNLTIIAKENTEHAMAISRVLENHCRTVSANGLRGAASSHSSSLLVLIRGLCD